MLFLNNVCVCVCVCARGLQGGRQLGRGIVQGVTGVVTQPIKGYSRAGEILLDHIEHM
jgi:hypothetical protein